MNEILQIEENDHNRKYTVGKLIARANKIKLDLNRKMSPLELAELLEKRENRSVAAKKIWSERRIDEESQRTSQENEQLEKSLRSKPDKDSIGLKKKDSLKSRLSEESRKKSVQLNEVEQIAQSRNSTTK